MLERIDTYNPILQNGNIQNVMPKCQDLLYPKELHTMVSECATILPYSQICQTLLGKGCGII